MKSIPQFDDLPDDRLSDLNDAYRIKRGKTVLGGRPGIKVEDAIHHLIERPVGMPEDKAIQAPKFLLHRLVHPGEDPTGMDQSQTETVYLNEQLIEEKTPNRGRIRIAVHRPDLLPVKNIQNRNIGQITGMQYQVRTVERPIQNSS